MTFAVDYKVKDKVRLAHLSDVTLDGAVGVRCDRFLFDRVTGEFAVKEILGEAESFFDTKFDDELSHGLWRGEFWGKQIISACEAFRYKKDEALKEKIRLSAYKVMSFQRQDGYLSTYRDSENIFPANPEITRVEIGWASRFNWNIWGQKYTLWGLIECALLLEDEKILESAEKMADFIVNQINGLGIRMKDAGVMDGMVSCSILRPLLVLYRLTAKESYFDLCCDIIKEWDRDDGEKPNLIANALSDKAPAHWYDEYDWFAKTYEMLSCFEGIIEMYRITGEKRLFDACEGFYRQLVKYERCIFGSVGHCAIFGDGAKYAESGTEICDAVHWMRFCREMYIVTGQGKYAQQIEETFVNAFLAGVYEDGKTGAFMVRSHGQHRYATIDCSTKYQNCCLNNIARGFMCAVQSVCGEDEAGYYVNTYVPHSAKFGTALIHTDEGYFDKGSVTVTVRNPGRGKKLFLYIPSWSKQTEIYVCGEKKVVNLRGEYYCVSLDADTRIRIVFDMSCEIVDMPVTLGELEQTNRHVLRWIDPDNGICNRELLLKTPKSYIRRGAVILARSKKIGNSQEEMFGEDTVFGKNAVCTAVSIRHDLTLCLCRVIIDDGQNVREFLMCDYASSSNSAHLDSRYFSVFV